jgi:hypothetical protein
MAAAPKQAAVPQNVATAPTSAIRRPATPGPTRKATPQVASWMPLARSGARPEARAASGSIASRAVIPAGSNVAPRTASAASHPTPRPIQASSNGMAATLMSESKSLVTETARRPTRSTIVPEISDVARSGISVTAPTAAAADGSPVRSSTSHGNATVAIPFAIPPSAVAVSSARSGHKRRSPGTRLLIRVSSPARARR